MENRKSKLKYEFKKIKRAIISVSDKSDLKNILPTLKIKIEIISSGGSFKKN